MDLGQLGHASVILAFVTALFGMYSLLFSDEKKLNGTDPFQKLAYKVFFVHAFAVFSVVASLFAIIYLHQYQYHYAWSHSSSQLPVYYMISCFWEGQEGSFLLWIFWHVLIGFFLLKIDPKWRKPVWMVYFSVQAFLLSMLLGVVLPGLELKIGSSPFVLLREVQPDAPVFAINPNFVPEDGRGLNPLLQNYWMVIHPPTLFLGFALVLVPFCYAIAGLWTKKYTEWIKPALGWTSLAAGVLGIGIAMGAYWAYETLNFGGYWNWDPVENAVYIPWVILVAGLHILVLYQSRRVGLRAAFLLTIGSFVLILYATFLTRSGILGNASVHSFTDLGLSGQLLLYMVVYIIAAGILLIVRWREIPASSREMELYSKEFWIATGALVLGLASFQVLATTSIPVYNAIGKAFGFELSLAPPSDPIAHYTFWQMAFFMVVVVLTGIGQFFYWRSESVKTIAKALNVPLNLSLILSMVIWFWFGMDDWKLILLLAFSLFGFLANVQILIRLWKTKVQMSGGSFAHIGLALVLIGILFSAGYSKVVSLNTSGTVYRKDFSTEMNRDNVLLWRHQAQKMGAYSIAYKGPRLELKNGLGFVSKDILVQSDEPHVGILTDSTQVAGVWKKPGDSLEFYPENTYYQIDYTDTIGGKFSLFPRAQVNPNMGLIASPDIRKFVTRDLYTHVTSIPSPEEEVQYGKPEQSVLHIGDTFFVADKVAVLEKVQKVENGFVKASLGPEDVAVEAVIRILGSDGMNLHSKPVFMIRNQQVGLLPDVVEDIGARLTLSEINPAAQTFTLNVETSKTDWVIMKAMEKPGINILWIGILVMSVGFGISVKRRLGKSEKGQKSTSQEPI
jgi:cytochrome c-type biogenesis protein CcmF